jgi:hypothetical protein
VPAHECDRLAQPLRGDFGGIAVVVDGVIGIPGGGFPAAEAACRRVMVEWPNEPHVAACLGRVLFEAGQYAAAYPYLRSAVEPLDPYGMFAPGQVFAFRRDLPGKRPPSAALRYFVLICWASWVLGGAGVRCRP